MISSLKQKLCMFILAVFVILIGGAIALPNYTEAAAPAYKTKTQSRITSDNDDKRWVLNPSKFVDPNKTLRENISNMFYPRDGNSASVIYIVIRDITLGVMIIFFVIAGVSLLLNKKPEESKKHLLSLLYIMLGGVLVYAANWIFGDVLHFNADHFTESAEGTEGMKGFTDSLIGKVFFVVLSTIKAAAFFLAIIMTVVTGLKVIAAGEGEKGKKLVKGLINVVVALLVIKGIDFIYYLAADSQNFVKNASEFIINVAKVFGYLYGIITVIMVIVAGYLFITDGGNGANFKKATNVIINILLSALVLFGFLLIVYQIFAEFQTGGDAVSDTSSEETPANPTTFLMIDKYYV